MLNTKLYKRVHTLATEMLEAAQSGDELVFTGLYQELQTLCSDNETSEKNHPVQWETLADFTEDVPEALGHYKKALESAEAINAKDYMASISYAMAMLLKEEGAIEEALVLAQQADQKAAKIEDKELQQEIKTFLTTFD